MVRLGAFCFFLDANLFTGLAIEEGVQVNDKSIS
jgi:hypothetical protein